MKNIALKELIGIRKLTAVETGYANDKNYISFVLDGKTYTAWEDESDGYRSCMDRLEASKRKVKNVIPETTVIVVFGKEFFGSSWTDNFLWFFAVENGKLVLEVGTDNSEDYYPSFLSVFYPENLPVNEDKAGK